MSPTRRSLALVTLLLALCASTSFAAGPGQCPAIQRPIPSAEARQQMDPFQVLRCFMTLVEIDLVRSSIGHDAQTTVTDPQFDSGELDPDGSPRPPLSIEQIAVLIEMHQILDEDMRAGAVIRKYIPNSDIGGYLYGRTVIGPPSSPQVVTTSAVRGFVGLERNTQGLSAGETIAALGLDYETAPLGQFTDEGPIQYRREVSLEVLAHGLHSIRHVMSAQAATDAKIPLAKDLRDAATAADARFSNRSFEMNRQGQSNPYTGLGMADDIGLLTLKVNDGDAGYRFRLNEEDVMTTPTPLAVGDELLRRKADGTERVIARYRAVTNSDGTVTNRWMVVRNLPRALARYYFRLYQQAAARVAAAGG